MLGGVRSHPHLPRSFRESRWIAWARVGGFRRLAGYTTGYTHAHPLHAVAPLVFPFVLWGGMGHPPSTRGRGHRKTGIQGLRPTGERERVPAGLAPGPRPEGLTGAKAAVDCDDPAGGPLPQRGTALRRGIGAGSPAGGRAVRLSCTAKAPGTWTAWDSGPGNGAVSGRRAEWQGPAARPGGGSRPGRAAGRKGGKRQLR